MPFWATLLEGSLYVLGPLFVYYYAKFLMANGKFNRVYKITEDANTFGRVDELRAINRELARLGSRLILVIVVLTVALGMFTYLWAVPHARGEI